MGSVKALEVAPSHGTGCLADVEVQTVPCPCSSCIHAVWAQLCPGGQSQRRPQLSITRGTHRGHFPLNQLQGSNPLRIQPAQPRLPMSQVLLQSRMIPTKPSSPFPKGCPLDAVSCTESSWVLLRGVKARGRRTAVAGLQNHKLFPRQDTPLLIFSVADRGITNPCLPSLPTPSGRNNLGSPV